MRENKAPYLFILVGPPGSGKSTFANRRIFNDGDHGAATVYVNQDSQGKGGHQEIFRNALYNKQDIILDRMNFNKQQRANYILEARKHDYFIEIIVLHQPYAVCLDRVLKRIGKHETIIDEKGARSALQTFFTKYERPTEDEADKLTFIYPDGPKRKVVVCDLDGTLCDVEHRRHHVRLTQEELASGKRKNWTAFFQDIPKDPINQWCKDIIEGLHLSGIHVVFCSGRGDNERKVTQEWLDKHSLGSFPLYMRNRHDSRQDSIVKEIILDFEILCRYEPYFMIDDRQQVVDMWRRRGYVCLQCDPGDF